MFFPERIKSIELSDRVLEVGPGGAAFHRSDVLLEKIFYDNDEAKEQRGHAEEIVTDKEIVFYEGSRFPFKDNEFDYVICSHVLEHIPSDEIEVFVSELSRVAKKGYLEFPTIYYDYIYNFPKHLTFLLYKNGVISYLGKEKTELNLFLPVQSFFYHSASAGHKGLTNSLKIYFFQGFEWSICVPVKEVKSISDVVYSDEIFSKIVKAPLQLSCKRQLANKIKSIFRRFTRNARLYILRDKFLLAHKKWVRDHGDTTLRLDYDLNSDSVVFDLGGYKGDFADAIYKKYDCYIYIFEPVKSYYNSICKRFRDFEKIKVFNFGLSDKEGQLVINLSDDGSSIYKAGGGKETVNVKDIRSFLSSQNIPQVDLMKINIEGGEFEVLPALINSGLINIFSDIQVQFHNFIKDAVQQRRNIRSNLISTHYLTYDYWFIWENWKKKE